MVRIVTLRRWFPILPCDMACFFLFLKVCQTVNFYFMDYEHLSFLLFAFIYVCEGLFAMGFMWMAGHLLGVASFLPLCEFQGSSLGLQPWRESSLPTDSSCQTMNVFSSSKNYSFLLLFASTVYDLCLFFLFNYFWVYKRSWCVINITCLLPLILFAGI